MRGEPKLYAPGKRGKNKNYIIRWWNKGRPVEKTTGTSNPEAAKKIFAGILNDIAHGINAAHEKTFSYCADAYKQFKNPKPYDIKRIDDICFVMGDVPIREVSQAKLVEVADLLFKGKHPATRNRSVVRPISGGVIALHYNVQPSPNPHA